MGEQRYLAVHPFFQFDQDGAFAEIQKVTRNIELSDDGTDFTATASVEVFDADDSLIQTNCASERARPLP